MKLLEGFVDQGNTGRRGGVYRNPEGAGGVWADYYGGLSQKVPAVIFDNESSASGDDRMSDENNYGVQKIWKQQKKSRQKAGIIIK